MKNKLLRKFEKKKSNTYCKNFISSSTDIDILQQLRIKDSLRILISVNNFKDVCPIRKITPK